LKTGESNIYTKDKEIRLYRGYSLLSYKPVVFPLEDSGKVAGQTPSGQCTEEAAPTSIPKYQPNWKIH
jgi:hypothetical protein